MTEWRNIIIDKIQFITANKTFITDYEAIISDEELLISIADLGFNYLLINSQTDPLDVRYQYETSFRNNSGDGQNKRLLIILQDPCQAKANLPYDIVYDAEEINIDFSLLFPSLDVTIIRLLEHNQYEALYKGIKHEKLTESKALTKQQSLIFVLRNVYRIHLLEIENDVDFASLLFSLHYTNKHIPEEIANQVSQYFKDENILLDWKVKDMITSPSFFWNYIQQIWDSTIGYTFYYFYDGGPSLNLIDKRLSIFLDNAFAEGYLKARKIKEEVWSEKKKVIPQSLLLLGAIQEKADPKEIISQKKAFLTNKIKESTVSVKSTYKEWLSFNQTYTNWLNLIEKSGDDSNEELRIRQHYNKIFYSWLSSHFDALCYETTNYPLIVLKILPFLMKRARQNGDNVALIVMDGMSFSDWITIKESLFKDHTEFSCDEHSCFAWVPSLTSVSRQVIFSGKFPRDFENTINTTRNEEKDWIEAWINGFGIQSEKVCLIKTFKEKDIDYLQTKLGNVKIIGIVINAIDELLHSSHVLGSSGLHNNIEQWVNTNLLKKVLELLIENDYQVFITADHGNTIAVGKGSINEGILVSEKGKRARIYNSDTLRQNAYAKSPDSIVWNSVTLPKDYLPLLAEYNTAYTTHGTEEITHGGISIEEVIIPFIEVKTNDR